MSKTERGPAVISGDRQGGVVLTLGDSGEGTLGVHPGLLPPPHPAGSPISLPAGSGISHRLFPSSLETKLVRPVDGRNPGLLP